MHWPRININFGVDLGVQGQGEISCLLELDIHWVRLQ